jgi:hypothetical protein
MYCLSAYSCRLSLDMNNSWTIETELEIQSISKPNYQLSIRSLQAETMFTSSLLPALVCIY